MPGRRIVCVRGNLWITQAGDPEDRVLGPGETFALDRPGIVLVNALDNDAALACEHGIELAYLRLPLVAGHGHAQSLTKAIDRIRPRYDTADLAITAPARRRALVEGEAHWMRSQVAALLVSQAVDAIRSAFHRFGVRPLAALTSALTAGAEKRRGGAQAH